MNLSPAWVPLLETAGYEVRHWSEIGAITAPDTEIIEWARENKYVVFTHDLDFGAILFATKQILRRFGSFKGSRKKCRLPK